MIINIHNINDYQNYTRDNQNLTNIEKDLKEIDLNNQEFNNFVSNYQIYFNNSGDALRQKVQQYQNNLAQFEKDNKLFGFFQEVSAQIKEINSRFNGLTIKINLSQQNSFENNKNDRLLTLFSQAKDLYSKEKKTEAFEKFTQVLEINPNFIDARIYRGIIGFSLNKGNLSLDVNNISYAQFDFEEVLKQDKQNLKALKGLSISNCQAQPQPRKCNYALKVIMHEPKSPLGNFNAADCLKFLGQYNENTLQYINQAIDQEKRRYDQRIQIYFRNKGKVIFYEGEILFGLNRVNEAREFVLKALEINQNYELAIKTLSKIYLDLGLERFDEILQRRANT